MLATPMTAQEVWTSQCEVARDILEDETLEGEIPEDEIPEDEIPEDSGVERALDYLIGGKFLNFLELAEDYPEWRDEIPNFVAEIRDIFDGWQITEYLNTLCQVGLMAAVGGQETGPLFRIPRADEMGSRGDARDRTLLAQAREWLADDED